MPKAVRRVRYCVCCMISTLWLLGLRGADGNIWRDTTNASQVVVVPALVFGILWPTVV
jgi:hypothetical protein